MHECVTIVGELPLVDEYKNLAAQGGMDVSIGSENIRRDADVAFELTVLDTPSKRSNLSMLDQALDATVPVLSSSVTVTVTEQASWMKHPERLIGIGALPSLLGGALVELAASPMTSGNTVDRAFSFFRALGKEPTLVKDLPGMVLPRIIGMLVNEACFAMEQKIAARADIDTAMRLGTNYPYGPLEWGERIGIRHIHAIVTSLHRYFGEDRYRVAPFLHRAAEVNRFPA